jgi:hypothetical protein
LLLNKTCQRFGTRGNILSLLATLIVIGFLLWMANKYIPMDATIKKVMNIGVSILIIVWLLNVVGVLGAVGTNSNIEWSQLSQ